MAAWRPNNDLIHVNLPDVSIQDIQNNPDIPDDVKQQLISNLDPNKDPRVSVNDNLPRAIDYDGSYRDYDRWYRDRYEKYTGVDGDYEHSGVGVLAPFDYNAYLEYKYAVENRGNNIKFNDFQEYLAGVSDSSNEVSNVNSETVGSGSSDLLPNSNSDSSSGLDLQTDILNDEISRNSDWWNKLTQFGEHMFDKYNEASRHNWKDAQDRAEYVTKNQYKWQVDGMRKAGFNPLLLARGFTASSYPDINAASVGNITQPSAPYSNYGSSELSSLASLYGALISSNTSQQIAILQNQLGIKNVNKDYVNGFISVLGSLLGSRYIGSRPSGGINIHNYIP